MGSTKRDRPFRAPWGRSVFVATLLGFSMLPLTLAIAICGMPRQAGMGRWLVGAVGPVLVVGTALFAVTGYRLEGRELVVRRPGWITRVPLDGLREVAADPEAMSRSFRACGNGGLFALTGWFRNRRLGFYRAWVTDPKRSVVLSFADRKVVVSPDDPAELVSRLRARMRRRE